MDDIKTDETGRVVDEDLLQFIDLVTKCLDLDPETRITPAEALRHLFCQKLLKTAKSGEKSAATEGMVEACASLSASLTKEGSGSSSVAASEAATKASEVTVDSSVASSKSKGDSSASSKSGK